MTPTSHYDVVVIGGGAAGLAAALQLGRSRRRVLVVDAGAPRNAPAAHMHGYLGHDGLPPTELLALGRDEVRRYGVELEEGSVSGVTHAADANGFEVVIDGSGTVTGRRVLLATGLVDELPDVPGVAEAWGSGVLHCPYCHGWEVQDQRIVVLGTGPLAAHQALLFRQLSEHVRIVLHDPEVELDETDERRLLARGVSIERAVVAEVMRADGAVTGVRLDDGRTIDADAVVVGPRMHPRWEPVRSLGIEPVPAPRGMGEMIETDARGETSVAGVYAAGNVADVSNQVLQAAAEGSRIAAAMNADLAAEDADLELGDPVGDTAEAWDERYGSEEQWWSGRPNGSLVAEVEGLSAGSAIDVGCGEGADAIWLAQRGWRVTGVDISQVALDRARQAASEVGVDAEWVRVDLPVEPLPGRFDLVSVHYPALRLSPGGEAIQALLDAVAPGGTLLVVGHDFAAADHQHHRFDPADYVQPPDVAKCLGDGWTIEVDESRPRARPPGHKGPDVPDRILRARRD